MIGRVIIAGALMLLVACIQDEEGNEPPVDFVPPVTPDTIGGMGQMQESAVAQSRLERLAPDTGSIGTARLLESDATGQMRTLAIEVSDLPAGSFTWELRRTSCRADAAGDALASGTLDVGAGRFGEASALLPNADLAGHSVVMRATSGEIVACAAF